MTKKTLKYIAKKFKRETCNKGQKRKRELKSEECKNQNKKLKTDNHIDKQQMIR